MKNRASTMSWLEGKADNQGAAELFRMIQRICLLRVSIHGKCQLSKDYTLLFSFLDHFGKEFGFEGFGQGSEGL